MIGYNPIYEYAALPDVPRILDAIRRTLALDVARGQDLAAPEPAASTDSTAPHPVSSAEAHSPQNTVIAGTQDIIVRVLHPTRRDIRSAADLEEAVKGVRRGDVLSLLVYSISGRTTKVVNLPVE